MSPRERRSYFHHKAASGLLLMPNLMLTLNCQSLIEIIWDMRDFPFPIKHAVSVKAHSSVPPDCASVDCQNVF